MGLDHRGQFSKTMKNKWKHPGMSLRAGQGPQGASLQPLLQHARSPHGFSEGFALSTER